MTNYLNKELQKRIESDFTYHPPTPEMIADMATLRDQARLLAHAINSLVPDGREKSTALTYLEIVVMEANAGIARNVTLPTQVHFKNG